MKIDAQQLLGSDVAYDPDSCLAELKKKYQFTERQIGFVEQYVRTNGERQKSLILAGYLADKSDILLDKSNKSPEAMKGRQSLASTGSMLMKNPRIIQAIEEYKSVFVSERRKSIEADVYKIAQKRATYDIREMVDTLLGNTPEQIAKQVKDMPEDLALCVDAIEFKYWGKDADRFTATIKFADRQRNIEFLSKLTGMLTERKEVKHTGSLLPNINIAVLNSDKSTSAGSQSS